MIVFVEEQGVPPHEEVDEYDAGAVHFVAIQNGEVIGTLRVVSKEEGKVAKIGRVAVALEKRGKGVGRELMIAAMTYARQNGFAECFLTAQVPVIPFYEKLGFVAHGDVFDDCGIPHRAMTLVLDRP
jgi:predicted GNAT family N-acyltransferase